ncbi:MAG: formyl transferase [Caulobacteraceae bacterium]|nr:formyl transferase [Caulobacteraceae bacterium]
MTGLDVPLRPEQSAADGPGPAEGSTAALSPHLSQIVVLVPSDRVRAWVLRLVDALQQQSGLPTKMLRAPWVARSRPAIPSEGLERHLLGVGAPGHTDWVTTAGLDAAEGVRWSDTLLVNATERDDRTFPPALRQSVILSPMFHGARGAEGVVRPLLSSETLHLGVVLSVRGASRLLQGVGVATPERAIMGRALHLVFGRTITLVQGAVEHVLSGRRLPDPIAPPAPRADAAGLEFWWGLTGAGLPRVKRLLQKPWVRHDWWCIGVRRLQRECAPVDLDLEPATFRILDAGPDRFYADPFLLRHDGVTAVFFEDYDYRLGRAAISYLVLDEDGRPGSPAEALSRPYHLSYPFVFVHDGVVLMVPETSENRTMELYEARSFPNDWRLRTVLMENVDASDTTLHFDSHAGLWWMLSAVSEFGSSSHDTLSIFYAERLEGPWRPHAGNPVKFAPGCSRPAGPLLSWNGRLFRPTQDCTHTYGGGLVWCEIKRLTPDMFCEEPVARQQPGRGFTGLHHYGRAAGFEVVDFKRDRSRLSADGRRLSS